jgi:spore germination protein
VEMQVVGNLSKTKIALVYDDSIVDQNVLQELKRRLEKVNVDLIQSTGELQKHIAQDPWNAFPTVVATERPDRAVLNISHGKVIIVVDKTPFVMIVPSVFSDFFTAMDDLVQLPVIGSFLRGLRYIGLALTLTLPGLYVGTISYNPEFFRIQLAFSVAASRAAVPYASYLEVIFMLLMMEFLTESSIRLPKVIGPTATTVGGLIVGQAATQAGLVSNIMIIIIAIVAISNFVIPINAMSFAIRVVKYPFLLLATFFGLPGVIIGLIGFVFYLSSIESFGVPYVKMFRKGDEA